MIGDRSHWYHVSWLVLWWNQNFELSVSKSTVSIYDESSDSDTCKEHEVIVWERHNSPERKNFNLI